MSSILTFLAEASVSAGIIWAATMALKRTLRTHLSPRAHLALWLVLIARLVLPVTLETGIHFAWLPAVSSPIIASPDPQMSAGTPAGSTSAVHVRIAPRTEKQEAPYSLPEQHEALPAAAQGSPQAESTLSFEADPSEIAVSVWVLGMLLGTALSLRGYDRLRRDVKDRLVPGADPLHKLFQVCLEEIGIRERVVLAVQDELAGPALMYPNIVLVPDHMHEMSGSAAKMAFRHELMHFQRRDHLKSLGLNVLRIIWWFNPVVWLAVRTIREDIETACDADVVRPLGKKGKNAYAKAVLSMFGRTETCQAVLGMAFGGAKKNAEKRIRGIFMKKKSSTCGRAAAICLAGILSVACLTTACQPTPEQEAVVNQKEGVPADALIGESETVNPEATTAPAAQYTVAETWTETIDKAEKFKVTANDVDILTPVVSAYPVEKLAPREITQELADELIAYFAPDAQFYSTQVEKTKAEWEEQILNMREVIQMELENGDSEAAADDQALIDEWTRHYESAPEEVERRPVTPVFTEMLDYSGNPVEGGKIYIDVWAENANGSDEQISIRQRNPEEPISFAYFSYMNANYTPESLDEQNQQFMAQERTSASSLEEPARTEELERLDAFEKQLNDRLALYGSNTMDLDEARRRGEQVLEDLGIRGAQIFEAEKAVLGPFHIAQTDAGSALSAEEVPYTEPAVYLTFQRENGGIPCMAQASQNKIPSSSRREYSAPFVPERGTIVFDENWNVRVFHWDSPSEPVEIVAPNSDLISLDEAKERLAEELYRNELAVSEQYIKEHGLEYAVEEMRLVMGYTDVADEPEDALAVPAWYMKAQGMQLDDAGDEADRILYNQQEVMISALDGAPILMPGTVQNYNYNYGQGE